jgi:hypothetical protein
MAPTRRAKIPDEQWEHWKTVIEQLFLQDNCTLDELVKRMSREHQFHARYEDLLSAQWAMEAFRDALITPIVFQ